MAESKQEIIKAIENHIAGCNGKYYSDYYVGIAKKPKDRLFKDHNVPEINYCWIYRTASSHTVARAVEKYFLDEGMKGGGGGGDEKSKAVYVYRISNKTEE